MNTAEHASGDNIITQPADVKKSMLLSHENVRGTDDMTNTNEVSEEKVVNQDTISPKIIDENEIKLKERIVQCKNIIASLKLELTEEKIKLEKEAKEVQLQSNDAPLKLQSNDAPLKLTSNNKSYTPEKRTDFTDLYNANIYSVSVDSKLNCDENLMEYEKQLQRYQNTLNMAQIEKKNAIRKQMLAKAFKLKLMEVENQCNIELLRIKQSLQCLEPLQMVVDKWKDFNNDNVYDLNSFELIPRYPELNAISGSDITNTSATDDIENKFDISSLNIEKHE